jgi:hypothetical protein
MIKLCESCQKYSSCEKLCPKVEKTLEKVYKYNKYGPEIVVTQLPQNNVKGKGINLSIDDARKIDPGQLYENTTDTEIEYDRKIEPQVGAVTAKNRKSLKKYIDKAIPYQNTKQKRRFNDFVRCTKPSKIAQKANTNRQNIQKQFQRTINKIHKMMIGSFTQTKQIITPKKFKEKITG